MDIAKLGFVVDSSQARTATKDVEALGTAARDTAQDVQRAETGIKGSANRIQRAMAGAASRSGAAWGKFRDSFNSLGGLGAIASSAALTSSVNNMIEVARSTEEAQALFDQVFQDSAGNVRKWSQDMAQQINRSAYDLQAQAALFQQVLAAMVPDRGQAAEMSTTLASLAQDIAAFYDISESDAIGKLRSGLTGETEPLKALGIVLSATAVEAKALELGLAGTASALTEADKVAARYALIMQLTADAQGAATREADSLSNQQKGLNGAWNDAYRNLGQNLLPAMTSLVQAMTGMVQSFNSLSPSVQRFIAYALGLAAAIGPVLTGLGFMSMALPPLAAAFGLLISPVGAAVAAFTALTVAGAYLWQNWDELSKKYPVIQAAGDALSAAWDLWTRSMTTALEVARPLADFLGENLTSAFRVIAALLKGDFVAAFDTWRQQMLSNMDALQGMAGKIVDAVQAGIVAGAAKMGEMASEALVWAQNVVASIKQGLADLYQAGVNAIADLARGFRDSVTGLIDEAKQWGSDIAAGITGGLAGAKNKVMDAGRGLAGWVKGAFTDETEIQSPSRVFMRFGRFITEGLSIGIRDGAQGPVAAMQSLTGGLLGSADDIKAGMSSILKTAITDFKNLGDAIGNVLDSIADRMLNSGLDALFAGFGRRDPLAAALSAAGVSGVRSFAGGGYTGNAQRIGGLDGRGGKLALLHPRETVIDHTKGGSAGMSYSPTFHVGGSVTPEDLAAVRREAAEGFRQMQRTMPARVSAINRDPLRKG